MTFRLARSPEAPNKTTVQGSATPPYTEPVRLVSPAIASPSCFLGLPSSEAVYLSRPNRVALLYLNPVLAKLRAQLLRALVVNRVHAELSGTFQIQRAVIDEETLFRRPLRNFQRDAKNRFLGFARTHVTRA